MTPISHQRLHNQHITRHQFTQPEEVVRYMGAMQAQDYEMSKWAVGVRLQQATNDLVEQALNDGRIIRTHVLRPTWHLVAAEDIRWMLDLTAPHVARLNSSMDRMLGLDERTYQKSNKIIEKALDQYSCLTREELMQHLKASGLDIHENRPAHYMFAAELSGLVCSGPRKGKQITYMLMDERVAASPKRTREENLAALALRYFKSHGPATIKDFAWWSGLNQTDVKKGIAACGKSLICENINNIDYWMTESSFATPVLAVHTLPAFDEFMVGYSDRSPSVHPDTARMAILGNGIFKPILVSNGEVTGTWKRTVKPKQVLVEHEVLQPLKSPESTQIRDAFVGYATFMEKPLAFK